MIFLKLENKKASMRKIEKLPVVTFGNLKGDSIISTNWDGEKQIIVICFNTNCDFCQFELKELEKRIPEFENTEIVLVSAEPLDTLRKFNSELQFDLYPNAGIYHCPNDTLQKYFGKPAAPTTFIYGTDRMLLKKFSGATRIDDMLDVILQNQPDNKNCLTNPLTDEQITDF